MKTTYYKLYSKEQNIVSEANYPTLQECEAVRKRRGGDWVCEKYGHWVEEEKKNKTLFNEK